MADLKLFLHVTPTLTGAPTTVDPFEIEYFEHVRPGGTPMGTGNGVRDHATTMLYMKSGRIIWIRDEHPEFVVKLMHYFKIPILGPTPGVPGTTNLSRGVEGGEADEQTNTTG